MTSIPSAVIYTGLSLAAGLIFFTVTLLTGDHTWVARIGGALWIFGLCMIILMPTITPLVRDRIRGKA
jgi:type IV secretory pathway TrbD component